VTRYFLHAFLGAHLLVAAATFAQTPPTSDPALEARVKALSSELRCLVCQNQTVADSDSMVARDMRDQVRAQFVAGKNEAEIKNYMTERFGDFVLYKPSFKTSTLLLWLGPFVVLALGLFALIHTVRKKQGAEVLSAPLSDADRKRARELLSNSEPISAEKSKSSS
jgi:cytochrome c-type biogenesis protein CcmH